MRPSELQERLAIFARDVARFAKPLLDRLATRDAARQIMRAATSAAANHRAAGRARSQAEFAAKVGIAVEEGDEVVFWFEHLSRLEVPECNKATPLIAEARELVAILTASFKTARRNLKRS